MSRPVSEASSNGHHAMVHLLLEHKASVDLQDAEGRTALMGAGGGFWAVHVDGDAEELSESEARRALVWWRHHDRRARVAEARADAIADDAELHAAAALQDTRRLWWREATL